MEKILGDREPGGRYVLSREKDLCEECGEFKRVVVRIRRGTLLDMAMDALLGREGRFFVSCIVTGAPKAPLCKG